MIDIKKLEELLIPVFEANSITKHKISRIAGSTPVLEICIMKEDGSMDLDICDIVSKQISDVLDVYDKSDESYMLDVCSFGAERELDGSQDIQNNVGNYVHVELLNPKKGLDCVEGTLVSYENSLLKVEYFIKGRKSTAEIDEENIKLIRLAVKL